VLFYEQRPITTRDRLEGDAETTRSAADDEQIPFTLLLDLAEGILTVHHVPV
jgi:hypothetical protein